MNYSKFMNYKKILTIVPCAFLASFMFFLGGCEKEPVAENEENEIEFSVDDKGYPQNDVVMINDKAYPLNLASESNMGSKLKLKWTKIVRFLRLFFLNIFRLTIGVLMK